MIPEFEPIADDFVETEVQRNGTDCEVERSRHQDVSIAEVPRAVDQSFVT